MCVPGDFYRGSHLQTTVTFLFGCTLTDQLPGPNGRPLLLATPASMLIPSNPSPTALLWIPPFLSPSQFSLPLTMCVSLSPSLSLLSLSLYLAITRDLSPALSISLAPSLCLSLFSGCSSPTARSDTPHKTSLGEQMVHHHLERYDLAFLVKWGAKPIKKGGPRTIGAPHTTLNTHTHTPPKSCTIYHQWNKSN